MIRPPFLKPSKHDESSDLSRRQFLGTVGASAAVVGAGGVSACIRKPVETILPYSRRPEDLIPGKPFYYATAAHFGGSVMGLLVESHQGRPTKVDGNPRHPGSQGATNVWAQGLVRELYDDDRSSAPLLDGQEVPWEHVDGFLKGLSGGLAKTSGAGLAVLLPSSPSPSLVAQLTSLKKQHPDARVYLHDPLGRPQSRAGLELVGVSHSETMISLSGARVIVALDADILGSNGDAVKNAREFAAGRVAGEEMNRLYAVEAAMSVTGVNADHRLRIRSSEVGSFLLALAQRLAAAGISPPSGLNLPEATPITSVAKPRVEAWLEALVEDLKANRGASVLAVGERQPPHVHALAHALNLALGNVGKTVHHHPSNEISAHGNLKDLTRALGEGQVKQLLILGGNPAYSAADDLDFESAIGLASVSVHLSFYRDETSGACTWHIPMAHVLESWGDLVTVDGTVSIQQPLIAPLYGKAYSSLEVLARVMGDDRSGYDIVRAHWSAAIAGRNQPSGLGFEGVWRRWLHDGLIADSSRQAVAPSFEWKGLAAAWPKAGKDEGLELNFILDPCVADGRFANNPWLQEIPDPISKLTWDNAALISKATADKYGVTSGDVIQITRAQQTLKIPVWVTVGVADGTMTLPLGYGRRAGVSVGDGAGFDVNRIRRADDGFIGQGASAEAVPDSLEPKGIRRYDLACTQKHQELTVMGYRRPLARVATKEEFKVDPNFVEKEEVMPADRLRSLWEQPNEKDGHQWGMTIDLSACIGCNACTVACQAENNIPTVGKSEVMNGRELHWIRIDQYIEGDDDTPDMLTQPLGCVHCETAPCEQVCPVAATTHSPEGLNDMTYNRCIGTRYCANNCPYKVRRFNYHNYAKRNDESMGTLFHMQRNPDVTIRFRGVIEKCSYCVQRVNEARIEAKRDGDGVIPDGRVVTACQQVCPSQAIVFGDVNNPESAVSLKKSEPRNYAMLAELNVHPRTTYLAKIRNPNPRLSKERSG